ncbi:AB-hydrolase YheT [Hyphopichia burtonii NRRL Y-1933]|uniref:AB-hydrolase YheT n=1 Tax=Hyphopichia burtonii NRRL Y-1933 TaxID=984485 RepID=A0A1E4RSC3_9ASCO|nr:AB-hydrolase YheT [Hyphopichia burtonii NRRL Y-1933]ODV70180.1 AB-hydrolase YheT [Hyphopichia burtonii NRRL Y-1933]
MVLSYLKSYVTNTVPQKPVPFVNKQDQTEAGLPDIIKQSVKELSEGYSYWLYPFLSSGHLQTAYTAVRKFENRDEVCYKRRLMTVEDIRYKVNDDELPYDRWEGQSTFAIDYVVAPGNEDKEHERFKPESQVLDLPPRTEYLDPSKEQSLLDDESKPLVIALHGLSGGSFESYLRAFVHKITQEPYGFDALVLNSRGCANHTITSPQLFCGLWTNDLRYLINEHILKKWPNKRIYLIGFSLGGAIIANYLGQEYDAVSKNIKASIIVSSPWSFPDSSYRLQESLLGNRLYSPAMCQNLLKLLKNHYEGHLKYDNVVDDYHKNPESYKVEKLKDFDDNFTSRLFGFNCADEYYRHASPSNRISKIRVPTILLNSQDDPIASYKSLPETEIKLNPYTVLIGTTIGGHLGWFDYKGDRWYAEPASNLFKELDKNWEINEKALKSSDLPLVEPTWKYDRIVS